MTDMDQDIDQRVEQLEGGFDKIVVILEGKPVLDIKGNPTKTEGGVVRELERHTEGLNVMSHQLDNILAQLPRCWTRTQRIAASMVVVVALGSISIWAF